MSGFSKSGPWTEWSNYCETEITVMRYSVWCCQKLCKFFIYSTKHDSTIKKIHVVFFLLGNKNLFRWWKYYLSKTQILKGRSTKPLQRLQKLFDDHILWFHLKNIWWRGDVLEWQYEAKLVLRIIVLNKPPNLLNCPLVVVTFARLNLCVCVCVCRTVRESEREGKWPRKWFLRIPALSVVIFIWMSLLSTLS